MIDYVYFNNCVNWNQSDVDEGLIPMIDRNIQITRSTFLNHVNRFELKNIEQSLGYESHPKQGLTMAGDWSVSYHRSVLHGDVVYYFKHSAIEYVFSRS